MTKLNSFRPSVNRPLGPAERKRVRIAATLVSATALVLGVASASALLNASSDSLAAWTKAATEPKVRMLAREGEDPAGKSCEDQTWPYIEQRCLKPADAKLSERSTPKHGLAAQSVVLPRAPVSAVNEAPTVTPETTGTASPRNDDTPAMTTANAPQPLQQTPSASEPTSPALGVEAASQRLDATPRLSPREARRLQREERKQLQRERRERAIRLRRESREDRIVRRWSEYTYESPNGGDQR
jgi:hypothetical protein